MIEIAAIKTKKATVPQLRFIEYDGEWVEYRLESLFLEFRSGQNITAASINETGKYPVFGGNGLRGFYNEYTHEGSYFLIGRQGALCGNINRSIGKAYFSEHAIACKANKNNDTEWLAQRLDYYNLNRLSESSAQPGLSVSKLLRFKLKVPSLPEQQKIASFLSSVDQKIQQLTKKKELLEQYKKGVMQRIFAAGKKSNDQLLINNDQLIKPIRFKQDDGKDYPEWKEKLLGEIATFLKGKGISKGDVSDDGTLECIRYGELYTLYGETIIEVFSKTNVPEKELVLSEADDVIIPASGETQIDIATASCVRKSNIALGGDLNIIRSSNDGVFLAYYLNSALKFDIARLSQGISVVHLYSSQLKTLRIAIPFIEEQQKIASFLSNIDNKINKVKSQIEKTQVFKKGLLQQMFV